MTVISVIFALPMRRRAHIGANPHLATSRCWVRLRGKTSTPVNRPSGSVGRAVEETSLAERAVTSQEPGNQVTTDPCASAGAGAETQREPPLSPQELSNAADEVATIEHPDNQGGDYSPTVIFRRRLPSDPPPVPLDDTSV